MNERRREKDWRLNDHQGKNRARQVAQIFGTGKHAASVVSEHAMLRDLTRFAGPKNPGRAAILREADKLLNDAARRENQKPRPPADADDPRPTEKPETPTGPPVEPPTLRERIVDRWIKRMRL